MRQADRLDRLLHLGNVVVDIVVTVPALPERGGDVLASRAAAVAGGGFNVMAAAARQGLRAAYAGAHGTGPFGTLARAALAEEGIEVIQPAKTALDTGFVLTMVETGGERTFLTSRGAEATLTAADLGRVSPAARDAIYVSGYGLVHDSNRAALLGWLARLGGRQLVFFDPGPLVGSIPAAALAAVLGRADWLACNAREAAILTGSADPRTAAAELAARASPAGRGCSCAPGRAAASSPGRATRWWPYPDSRWASSTPTAQATPTAARSSPRWRRVRRTPPPRAARTPRPRSRSPGAGRRRPRPGRN